MNKLLHILITTLLIAATPNMATSADAQQQKRTTTAKKHTTQRKTTTTAKKKGTKMREAAIWNYERMPIIDGMPASVPDGQPHTPEPWEES